jgi:PadR family transcriptional regulator, regulatory protein PadR
MGGKDRAKPRVTFQTALVLRALLTDPTKARYGLDVANSTGLPTGTIYPILARLEAAGWVSSGWEAIDPAEEGRPRRRLYYLTGEGAFSARAALDDMRGKLAPVRWQPGSVLSPGGDGL